MICSVISWWSFGTQVNADRCASAGEITPDAATYLKGLVLGRWARWHRPDDFTFLRHAWSVAAAPARHWRPLEDGAGCRQIVLRSRFQEADEVDGDEALP